MELRGHLALDRGQRLALRPARRFQREQAGVFERDRGLVGERLGEVHVFRAEVTPGTIAHGQHAEHAAPDGQRRGEQGTVRRSLDPAQGFRPVGDPGIDQRVAGHHGPPLAHGQSGDALVGGQGPRPLEGQPRLPRHRHRHQAVGLGVEAIQDGRAGAQ